LPAPLVNREVFTNLHESNLIPVADVIEILEENCLFFVSFIIILVLLDGFSRHVLANGSRLYVDRVFVVVLVYEETSKPGVLAVAVVQVDEVLLYGSVSCFGSLPEPIHHTNLTAHIRVWVISILSVFVLEYFVFNHVFIVLVNLIVMAYFYEIVSFGVEFMIICSGVRVH